EDSRKQKDDDTPIGRSGTGEDIARMVLYLCDDDSDMITGSVFEITGGEDVINRYRSEEHTSELQSRFDLVCRLLLEKKNSTDPVADLFTQAGLDNQTELTHTNH